MFAIVDEWSARLPAVSSHGSSIIILCFFPCLACPPADGSLLVTASADGTARAFEMERGQCLRVLAGHTVALTALAIDPWARFVVTASADGTARVWDLSSSRSAHVLKTGSTPDQGAAACRVRVYVCCVCCSRDAKFASRQFTRVPSLSCRPCAPLLPSMQAARWRWRCLPARALRCWAAPTTRPGCTTSSQVPLALLQLLLRRLRRLVSVLGFFFTAAGSSPRDLCRAAALLLLRLQGSAWACWRGTPTG